MKPGGIHSGDNVDGFTIGELVYSRGMANLWSVTYPDYDIPLLMKIPMIGEGDDPAAIVGFEMEQMIMPRITGRYVPKFIANGNFMVMPYIVMEWVQGTSLFARLKELPLPASEVAEIGARIADALDDLHSQHVVHLDIKPSNIIMRDNGDAVLIDYGLSHHNQFPDLMQEQFHLPYGTAPYMAPEQLLGTRTDYRSDLFALGVLMYFFATGERPFGNPQRFKGMKRRLWRDPVPPRKLRPEIPEALQEIILRCLEVNPAWRYPTAAQLALDLRNLNSVKLTARAHKMKRDPWRDVIRRRFNPIPLETVKPSVVEAQRANAPIILVAIDLNEQSAALASALRQCVERTLFNVPDARIACLNVLKVNRIAMDSSLDEKGRNKHVLRLAELKAWAQGLETNGDAVTFHVLEAVSASEALLEYARKNRVNHIVMGARAESTMRSMLGSVSGAVAAHAPCSVTVVRSRNFEAEIVS
ncbi:bifunctional serine/threonine-protein kinase/universal stress protein [Microvirga sp. W0021]|uniref:Bifunctional serine/threonine-protein kinase/universal stress protein n=1 Tax=Hohaiivirga grylli TaxID=3133970 RepID=A0ABV0BF37_9HYPH